MGPAFIVVLKVGADKRACSAHLIHIEGDNLGRVLRFLRQASASGHCLTKQFVSFSSSRHGKAVPFDANELTAAIRACIGKSQYDYIENKKKQHENLGYSGNAISASVSFVGTLPDIVDGLLDLKPLTVSKFDVTTTRFGIPVADFKKPIKDCTVKISPTIPDFATLVARPIDGSSPLSFKAELRTPQLPNLPSVHFKMLVICSLFSMTLREKTVSLKNDPEKFKTVEVDLDEWRNFWAFLVAAATAGIEFEMTHPVHGLLPFGRIEPAGMKVDVDMARSALALCDAALKVIALCGIKLEPVSWRELEAAAPELAGLMLLHSAAGDAGSVAVDVEGCPQFPDVPRPSNYLYAFPLGKAMIAYSVASEAYFVETTQPGSTKRTATIRAHFRKFCIVRTISAGNKAFEMFMESVARQTGISDCMATVSERAPDATPTKIAAELTIGVCGQAEVTATPFATHQSMTDPLSTVHDNPRSDATGPDHEYSLTMEEVADGGDCLLRSGRRDA